MKLYKIIIPLIFSLASYGILGNAQEKKTFSPISKNKSEYVTIFDNYPFLKEGEFLEFVDGIKEVQEYYKKKLYKTWYIGPININWKCEKLELKLKEYKSDLGSFKGSLKCKPLKNQYNLGLQFKLN